MLIMLLKGAKEDTDIINIDKSFFQLRLLSNWVISAWKLAGALTRPKGIRFHWYTPVEVTNADLWVIPESMGTNQKPEA